MLEHEAGKVGSGYDDRFWMIWTEEVVFNLELEETIVVFLLECDRSDQHLIVREEKAQ